MKDVGDDKVDGLSREAVLRAITEFDASGRKGFLARYGYRRSRHLWIVHEGRRYDMKAVWAAAQVEPGTSLPVPIPEPNNSRHIVKPQLEKLGFTVEDSRPDVSQVSVVAPRNQILSDRREPERRGVPSMLRFPSSRAETVSMTPNTSRSCASMRIPVRETSRW